MTDEQVAIKITELDRRLVSLEHRVKNCEKASDDITELIISVNKLAISMENMVGEQKRQGELLNKQAERLDAFEEAPLKEYNYYKRLLVGCICTGIVSFILGNVLSHILSVIF